MAPPNITRRRFVYVTGATSAALVAAPFVREAYAFGKLTLGLRHLWARDDESTLPVKAPGPNFMTREMMAAIPFKIIQSGPGPQSNATTSLEYDKFPCSGVHAGGIALRDTTWDGDKYQQLWDAGSSPTRQRPNSLETGGGGTSRAGVPFAGSTPKDSKGRELRWDFSTPQKAMYAVQAALMYIKGASLEEIQRYIAAAGYGPGDIIDMHSVLAGGFSAIDATFSRIYRPTNPNYAWPDYATTHDKVLLPWWRLCDAKGSGRRGVMLDLEANDGRSGNDTIGHTRRMRLICDRTDWGDRRRWDLLGFYGTPLHYGIAAKNGTTHESMPAIHELYDGLFIPVSAPNISKTTGAKALIDAQLNVIRGPSGVIPANPTLADTGGNADAHAIRPDPAIKAYAVGQAWRFKIGAANTTTRPTLAVSGLPAGVITRFNGEALAVGQLRPSATIEVRVTTVDAANVPTFCLQLDLGKIGIMPSQGTTPALSERDSIDIHDAIVELGLYGINFLGWSTGGSITNFSVLRQWRLFFGKATPTQDVSSIPRPATHRLQTR